MADLQRMNLLRDRQPVTPGRDAGINGREIDVAHIGVERKHTALEHLEYLGPVHAERTPPVSRARLLVIGDVFVKGGQVFEHRTRFGHGHVVVRAAVQNIDAFLRVVAAHQQRIACGRSTVQDALDGRRVRDFLSARIREETDPARARRDRSELIGE